jgi:hypothetical protein
LRFRTICHLMPLPYLIGEFAATQRIHPSLLCRGELGDGACIRLLFKRRIISADFIFVERFGRLIFQHFQPIQIKPSHWIWKCR